MAIAHAQPGEAVDVRPLGSALADTKTRTLFKTENVEAVRCMRKQMPANTQVNHVSVCVGVGHEVDPKCGVHLSKWPHRCKRWHGHAA